jgi:2-polyprenyl-3-methyl-5-hydroxy-6-metoxy-1,4-benzoquinol methylase
LSACDYEYKKKILRVYHLVHREVANMNDPILDYGGGAGACVQYLAAKGYTKVDIADIPSPHLDFVRKEMSSLLRAVITVTGSETYPEHEYAAIITLDCLEHTMEPLAIMRKLLRALKPGGLLVINFPKEDDFTHAHLEAAQKERDATFELIAQTCETLVPQYAYRKKR